MKQTLADALARKGYDALTPVQDAVSQPELEGRDLLVSAQTGSGKTIAFGLAIAPTLLGEDEAFGPSGAPLALVIAPTRELALQVKRELGWLYGEAGAFLASTVGGMDIRDERRALARGCHVVVATPGRLRDHIMRGAIDLSAVRAVVLDEADEMLDLGFREDLEFILEQTPPERQTLLFSATVPAAIAKLAKSYQRDAERISTVGETKQHADIAYRALSVAPRDGDAAVINVLRYYEAPNAIVFCNTRAMVARLTARLSNRGFSVVALSGELTQGERSNALQSMRDGRARVCVATDVAARGIDLPNLDLVIHAELPGSHETLLHRSGRTGRAGRKGVSALIVPPASRKKAERILKFAKLTAEWSGAPSAEEVNAQDQARLLASDDWQSEIEDSVRETVETLVASFTPEQLATAYLRQYQRAHSAPEELGAVDVKAPKARAPFGPSVWFSISEGHNDNASPRYLLPMVCKAGGITKDDIGAIRITDALSYVEIRAEKADGFMAELGPEMTIEGSKKIERLSEAPDLPSPPPRERRSHGSGGPRRRPSTPPTDWNDAPSPRARKPKPADRTYGKSERPSESRAPRKPKADPAVHAPGRKRPSGDGGSWEKGKPAEPRGDKPRSKGASGKDNFGKPGGNKGAPGKKPGGKFSGGKPSGGKPTGGKSSGGKPAGGKPAGAKPTGGKPASKTGPKGPPPPKGKPNSKKNKARAAAAKSGKGGDAVPKRQR